MAMPCNLRCEHHQPNFRGLGTSQPRLSWSHAKVIPNWRQASYELEIEYATGAKQRHAVVTSQDRLVPWPFDPLTSRQAVLLRVRVFAVGDNEPSEWSDTVTVEAGLLHREDWRCSLIEPSFETLLQPEIAHRPVVFRRRFQLEKKLLSARLYITAHGVYLARMNGRQIGNHVLAPGWTSYRHRLLYQTYDVTSQLEHSTENRLDVEVAEGWYCGRLGWGAGRRDLYGEKLGVIAILAINFEDGTTEDIVSDNSWSCSFGSRISSGLYDGEVEDLRESTPCDRPVEVKACVDNLCAPLGPMVANVEEVNVRTIFKSPSGKTLIDFGQNLVGRCRAKLHGERGQKVTLRHAEVLENGELGTRPLRCARATDQVILSGEPTIWEPMFTIHGFRYVEVEGWPGEISPSDIVTVVVHSDMARTGHFECSSPMLNQLHKNVVWSMRSNFVGVPTDCPQRDERLGWTGDINVFAETANFLYDTSGVLTSWAEDVRAEQAERQGIVPLTVPHVVEGLDQEAHAIWGDVVVMLPWALHSAFGDSQLLVRHFTGMKDWLRAIPRRTDGLWNYTSTWKLGDWLDPFAPPDDPGNGKTDPTLVSDAFLIHVNDLVARIAGIIGDQAASQDFESQSVQYRKAFAREYISDAGRVVADTETAYVLALHFNLLPTLDQFQYAANRLEYLILNHSRFRIATGFAGTPYIGHAMSKAGRSDLFYRMLLHRQCPSWLYPVSMGATTIWERWDSMLPDGMINPGEMTSFNHYALGSVADWMHTTILGLRPLSPGWSSFAVEPVPGGGLTWARGRFATCRGVIRVFWCIEASDAGDKQHTYWLRLVVPPNTTAQVRLPGSDQVEEKLSGTHEWRVPHKLKTDWPPRAVYPPSLTPDDDLPDDPILPTPEPDDAM